MPLLTWHRYRPAHVLLYVHNSRSFGMYVVGHYACLMVIVVGFGAFLLARGADVLLVLPKVALWLLVGTALINVALVLVVRFGVRANAVVTIVLTIMSVMLGGDALADTFLWLFIGRSGVSRHR